MQPPPYFEDIRQRAQNRWDQLEADPELAAPWHQLFKQVQSPRHVISELLQNADDACATKAQVNIRDSEFEFTHNGGDFEPTHFASLCRFGYSNKRALHTIGFRGIGFKSTFSLGDEVRLATPTLSVAFRRARFTQPQWVESNGRRPKETTVRVVFQDGHRRTEIRKNLTTWLESPASLLFFRSLRHLTLGDHGVVWNTVGPGPVPDSEWVALDKSDEPPVLLVRSDVEEFPEECVDEIRQERMLNDTEDGSLPPCKVEIVLGLEGRLFVVLPTGVKTDLPYACNAPFIQDPARVKIKDPETSPTNRWLLERAGKLAAQTMLCWLARNDLTPAERSDAYRLIPSNSTTEDSIEGACLEIVSQAFSQSLQGQPILLTNKGKLAGKDSCIAIPTWLMDVWDDKQISALFDSAHRALFCNAVHASTRSTLVRHGYLTAFGDEQVLAVLRSNHLPRPKSWRKLLNLWVAVLPHVSKYTYAWMSSWKDIRIVPVQAQDTLYSAQEVIRLGEKKLLHSEGDWDFLSKYLLVMNPNWPRFLTEQRRNAEANEDEELAKLVQAAERTLQAIGLDESSDATEVIAQVTTSFFGQEEVERADCIRLAQIAATLSVQAADDFEFVTLGGTRSSRRQMSPLIADSRSDFDLFAAETWCNQHVLHGDYWTEFRSCTAEVWKQWLASGRSGLLGFIPLQQQRREVHGEYTFTNLLKQRGHNGNVSLPYVTSNFIIEDWDFPEEHWWHWDALARSDKEFWSKLLKRILEQPQSFWKGALEAKAQQVATTGRCQTLATPGLLPAWIFKFRQRKCLQDTWGHLREPVDLLRRTAATESLLDVEPFIRAELDTETVRPLLSRLGVRDTPTGPDRLIDRLKALSTVKNAPVFEVQKWCHRLDGMLPKCSTEEFQKIKTAFCTQSLILTANGTWAKVNEVFLSPDDHDVPGAAIVHDELRSLTMWQKIGVEERPTLELVLARLQNLPQNQKLAPDVLRRVRDLLPRHPHRIWFDCDCWLNLEGEWIDVADLRYSISMHSLSAWGHLFPSVKKQVADFQRLSADVVHDEPFSGLPSLASCLEERVQSNLFSPTAPVTKPWLSALGTGLSRIVTDSDEKTRSIRGNANRLAQTAWQTTTVLETVPYLDGTPAGTARPNEVLWDGRVLFVVDRPIMQLLRQIAKELARPFDDPEIEDAIKFCINRSAEHVSEYLEQNFTLSEAGEVGVVDDTHPEAPAVEIDDNETGPVIDDLPDEDDLETSDVDSETDDDPVSEDELVEAGEPEPETRPPPTRNPKHQSKTLPLIDRYALAQGFKREANGDRFFHADGRWLLNQSGQSFQWEMFSAEGQLLRAILVREHCLEREPLQMASEVWEAYRKTPDTHSLLVTGNEGNPQELSGGDLLRMVKDGKLLLYPATYRVVCAADEAHSDELLQV